MSSIVPDALDLLVNLQHSIRGLADLVTILGDDTGNVLLYDDDSEGDLGARIKALEQPKLLLYLAGITGSPFPARMSISVGMAIKGPHATGIYAEICGGTSTASGSDGQPLIASIIHPRFSAMGIPHLERKSISFGREGILEYWEIEAAFKDRGF